MKSSNLPTDITSKPKRKPGRPSEYSEQRGLEVARLYASGVPFHEIGTREGMPHRDTIAKWRVDYAEFSDVLVRAREPKGEYHAEQALAELRAVDLDAMAETNPRAMSAAVNLAAKRSDYHKWMASCMSATYRDRQEIAITGDIAVRGIMGAPLVAQARIVEARESAPKLEAGGEAGD